MENFEEVLVCKCESCTHWEVTKEHLICKTCGLHIDLPLGIEIFFEKSPFLHWEKRDA